MIAILHNIRSLHNVGSIFRTADAAGMEKIYLCGYTSSPADELGRIRPEIAKVALGAEKTVAWEKIKSTAKLLDKLRAGNLGKKYRIFAVEQSLDSVPYTSVCLRKKELEETAVLMGPEVEGLPLSLLKKADKILEIPMRGRKESLNVSVAFGVAVYGLTLNSKI